MLTSPAVAVNEPPLGRAFIAIGAVLVHGFKFGAVRETPGKAST